MNRNVVRKKYLRAAGSVLLVALMFSLFPFQQATAAEPPILYLFWGDGCPHCEKEKEFLEELRQDYPQVEMRLFEVWKNPEFAQLADALRQAYEVNSASVPLTFLGKWTLTGFQSAEDSGVQITKQVEACLQQGCPDALAALGPRRITLKIRDEAARNEPVGWELYPASSPPDDTAQTPSGDTIADTVPHATSPSSGNSSTDPTLPSQQANSAGTDTISIPFFGNLGVSQTGLPLFTVLIAGLDGFNPCAIWVLCMLLTLVIYAKSRARILLIGGIFVLASGGIYFLFMTAWLNLFMLVGYVTWMRIAVGSLALVMGLINCKDFFFFKQGVSLTIPESAQPKLFQKMRNVVHTAALPGMIAGTIALAVTANLIELLCTAGFPAIYTRILTLQNFSVFHYYLYLVFYNIIYVIPLAAIVGVFAWKMGGRKLTEKEGRILKLVGGTLMLALGIVLIVKPQLLMFG